MTVSIDTQGPVFIVSIDRSDKRNAVDPATATLLRDAFTAFEADETLRVAILTGSGGSFCAGFDLSAVGSTRYDPDGPGPMGPTRMLTTKPVIAAVEGHAVAGGLELALWCDLRVASATAIFGVFCRRWGVPLIDGGTVRLPRIVGQGDQSGRTRRWRWASPIASYPEGRRCPQPSHWRRVSRHSRSCA